jgi:hypothetical protein
MACTDPELGKLIGSYELNLLSDEERKRFEDHVVTCDECVKDLYRMAPVAQGMLDGKAVPTKPEEQSSRSRNWMLLAASLAVVSVGLYAVMRESPPDETLRGIEGGTVVLFEPIGEVPFPERLDWKTVPLASHYEVTIETTAGETFWSEEVEVPPVTLPAEVVARMAPGAAYFWRVEAVAADGTRWRSDTTRFEVWK